MPGKSDIEEPPETIYSFPYKIKKLINKLKILLNRQTEPIDQKLNLEDNLIQPNIIIQNFESFAEKTVEDIMIPRSDIIAVSCEASLEDISKTIIKYGHTRTLVYKENLDNVIGFLHIKDLFEVIAKSKKYNLKKLMRKHIVSPHSMTLIDLLKQMQIHRTHIAVVVDEYGGTDGIVTIEDVIEAIIGRINDEHDESLDGENIEIIKPGVMIVNARVEIEELEKILGVSLRKEEGEFDTIGGLVLAKIGTVPEKGEVIAITEEVTIEILDSTPRAIKQLKVICNKKQVY
ncbi:MAG: HlyC/CorC family transporter [Rickettsiaceae bacterium]|nr:HlyC/CorC family transporter [Rickettsiaceae bacterium]